MWRVVLLLLVVLAGCKSRQKLGVNPYPNCKFAMYSKSELVEKLDSSALQFEWIKLKTKVDAEYNDEKMNFQVQMRIKKDSLVFAKISKSGFTGIKLLATRDTVVYVDKMNKKYFSGSYDDLEKLINIKVPFEFIQNVFLGEPTFLYENEGFQKIVEPLISYSSQSFDKDLNDVGFNQVQSFTCDSLYLKTVGILDSETKKEVWFEYDKRGDINGYSLNKNINVKGFQGEKQLILAEIELKRIKTFDDLDAPIEIPDDFEKMEIK